MPLEAKTLRQAHDPVARHRPAGGLRRLNRQWKVLRSPYLWIGAGVALLLWVPNLLWQADHGWPTLAMSGALQEKHSGRLHDHLRRPTVRASRRLGCPGVARRTLGASARAAISPTAVRRGVPAALHVLMVAMADRPYYLAPLYVVLSAPDRSSPRE